jgi:hypothetical protein
VFVNSLFDWSCAWDFTSTSSIGAVIESLSFFHIFLIRKRKKKIYIYIYMKKFKHSIKGPIEEVVVKPSMRPIKQRINKTLNKLDHSL